MKVAYALVRRRTIFHMLPVSEGMAVVVVLWERSRPSCVLPSTVLLVVPTKNHAREGGG